MINLKKKKIKSNVMTSLIFWTSFFAKSLDNLLYRSDAVSSKTHFMIHFYSFSCFYDFNLQKFVCN